MKSALVSSLLTASVASAAMAPINFSVLRGESFHNAFKGYIPSLKAATVTNSTVPLSVEDLGVFYAVNVTISGQQLEVLIDTGSSDLWVIASDAEYCKVGDDSEELQRFRKREVESTYYDCDTVEPISSVSDFEEYGLYDTKDFNATDELFYIQYGDYTFAQGVWGSADVSLSGVDVKSLTIGVANITNSTPTVFGIGLMGNEASNAYYMDQAFTYSNLPVALKEQGYIDKLMFSLSMNADNSEGTVLFGGIDDSGYTGDLVTLPMDNIYGSYGFEKPITFNVIMEGITYTSGTEETSDFLGGSTSVLLDSGTSDVLIPSSAMEGIVKATNATYNSDYGIYVCDCSAASSTDTINYKFDGITIKAPLSDMLIQIEEGSSECALMLAETVGTYNILGDPFLRSAYVVYDLENYEISLAQVA